MSHELRTPLALILAPAERILAEDELAPDSPGRRDIEVVLRNARVLLGHVNDLLDTSKIEAAKLELKYAELDLAHLVRLVANSFETLAVDRAVHFVVVAPESEVAAQVDPGRVQQVLLNLLSNAFKFTPKDGTVRIELLQPAESDEVRVEVADSGPGIPSGRRHEIFERFHQLDGTWNARCAAPGSGSTSPASWCCCTAVTSVWPTHPRAVRSSWSSCRSRRRPGPTSAPKARLPSTPSRSRSSWPVTIPAATEGGSPRPRPRSVADLPEVLVVEDNADMNRFVCEALAPTYRVYSALDGAEGLELARSVKPDLIVCDFMMPNMSGDGLVREVRADPAIDSTPILILTRATTRRLASTSSAPERTTIC